MKTKYSKLFLFLIAGITLSFASCSSDDDTVIEKEGTTQLEFEEEDVRVIIGSSTEINISAGNGDYKVFSLNEDIAKVELVDNKVVISGLSAGETAVVVSDQDNQYKNNSVVSYYDGIKTGVEEFDLKKRLGGISTHKIEITQGNGDYVAESSNEEIAKVLEVEDNILTIETREVGEINITITDRLGYELVVPTTITNTTYPYNDSELAEILKDDSRRYHFADRDVHEYYYDFVNTTENDMNVYGWDYSNGWFEFYIYFPGDKEVGVKENSLITYDRWGPDLYKEPVYFEIVKNDGENIWAIFSILKFPT